MPLVRRLFSQPDEREETFLGELFRRETVGGALALVAAVVGIVWANSAWSDAYLDLRHLERGAARPRALGRRRRSRPCSSSWPASSSSASWCWARCAGPADAAVPVAAAVCGVAVPALVYLLVNSGDGGRPEGWAVPAATDIAFALAVLAVVGSNLPTALRAFLLTLAVVDDLLVIAIIAVFFTDSLDLAWLAVALVALAAWVLLQRDPGDPVGGYLPDRPGGLVGGPRVRHPRDGRRRGTGPADAGRDGRAPRARAVAGLVGVAVPFFALMSAGVVLSGGEICCRDPVVIGVVAGLVLGKPVGVLLGAWLVARFTRAELDPSIGWRDVAGMAVLAGIGFTVSLLVSDLSFTGVERDAAKTAVLAGSLARGSARRPASRAPRPAAAHAVTQ